MSRKHRAELRKVLKSEGMSIINGDFVKNPEYDMEPFPTWPGLTEKQNRRQVEFHANRN